MNNIKKIAHDACTGCGACYNKCPVDAISMGKDEQGYLYPILNTDKCIDCGLCLKCCPSEHDFRNDNESNPECVAVWASDEIRQKSSSGGMFTLLAEQIFNEGGVVFGSAFTADFYGAQHQIARNAEELIPLRGSKYVQSEIKETYREAKKHLDNGFPVLFTGCPCQIAGLYGFLGTDYPNLYTADLVCHGVPSAALLKTFVQEEEQKANSKATYLAFRDKAVSKWGDLRTAIDFENGKTYRKGRKNCPWLKSFLNGLSFRESCGKCKFASIPRQGDITIADFWDIHRYNSSFDDTQGTSLVILNNEKGRSLAKKIKGNTKLYEIAPLDHAIQYNRQIKYSSLLHPGRKKMFQLLPRSSFENAVNFAINKDKYDIGFIGWWYGANWGSMMTCYAMNRVLTAMGKSVLMLPFPDKEKSSARKHGQYIRTIAENFYNEGANCTLADYHLFNDMCDTFLVGSDQLWNWWSNRDIGTYYYFCDFVNNSHKKIAYATSFGHESDDYPENMRLKVAYLLSRFDAISVREKSGVDILKKDFEIDAVQTMDPVFLCSLDDYKKMIDLSTLTFNSEFVLGYFLNPDEEKLKSLRVTAAKLGKPYRLIVDGQSDFEKLRADTNNDENIVRLDKVEDWLSHFWNAKHIVTDSFHGFCYSLIFSKQMTIFPNTLRGLTRFESIANIADVSDRFVYSYEEVTKNSLWDKKINYKKLHEKLKPHIAYSLDWLDTALKANIRTISSKELLLWKCLEHDEKIHNMKVNELNEEINSLKERLDTLEKLVTKKIN